MITSMGCILQSFWSDWLQKVGCWAYYVLLKYSNKKREKTNGDKSGVRGDYLLQIFHIGISLFLIVHFLLI